MNYPYQCSRTYANPEGNLAASGYYRSSVSQELMNMMPSWMHMRDNPRSIGQQFISPEAMELKRLETTLNDLMKSKFLSIAPIDEIDVLYRVKLPSNLNLTDATASGVRCIAAPSGCSPSGVNQIWVSEVVTLKEFYYDVLPTRIEVYASGAYVTSVDGNSWHTQPSGVLDLEEKHMDIWKKTHDISWAYTPDGLYGTMRKQDTETMEDYEVYAHPGTGYVTDMDFYKGILWCVQNYGSDYYLTLMSTKTQVPNELAMDTLARFDMTHAFDFEPSGILVGDEGKLWICDTNKSRTYEIYPRYDYFILDKDNRYLYFREDYRDSGVFISNT